MRRSGVTPWLVVGGMQQACADHPLRAACPHVFPNMISAMTVLELTQHPELAALADELRKGGIVVITDHGKPLGEMCPARPGREHWRQRLEDLHRSFVTPAYPGNSVVDMRQESR